MNDKTPKEKLVAKMDKPFTLVSKDERKSPLRSINPRDCTHEKAFQTNAYPTSGPTWVCVNCGKITDYPRDLKS